MENDFDQINWYHDLKQQAKTFTMMNHELEDVIYSINGAYAAEFITKFQYVKLITRTYARLMWINVIH